MDPSATGFALFLFVLLLLVNAFFVAAEYAFVRVRGTQLQELIEAGSARARKAMRILLSLDSYISAIQLGVTFAALGIGLVGEPAVARLIGPVFEPLGAPVIVSVLSFLIAFALVTYATVVLAELAPKYLALDRALELALWTAYPLDLFHSLMRPFINAINGSAFGVLRLFGVRPGAEAQAHSAEELRMLVAASTKNGILQESERILVGNALDFAETLVRQVMVPRTEIVAIPDDSTVEGVVQLLRQSPFTRLPVYREDLDHIVGVVHVKDVVGAAPARPVSELMRKPLYLPETAHLDRALAQFRRERVQLAIVIDEFGGTAGLVTLEDVIEELVGEVQDEFDRDVPMLREESGVYLINGLMTLPDVRERLGLDLSNEPYDTVGGMIFGRLGRLAQVGDSVEVEGYRFTVTAVAGRRVAQVKAKKLPAKV
ncbi:MAG TPA: hemolysin family protein [Candidatus Saccharimonadales bacterium]|jgi:CBS domain containing-hemolysin-like protein|nr:hemolysin family protein [Candidatus Saccharimonadales bacterium]